MFLIAVFILYVQEKLHSTSHKPIGIVSRIFIIIIMSDKNNYAFDFLKKSSFLK